MESQSIWETFFGLVNFVYFPLYVQPRFMPELEFQHFGLRVHPTILEWPVHPRPLLVPCAPRGHVRQGQWPPVLPHTAWS